MSSGDAIKVLLVGDDDFASELKTQLFRLNVEVSGHCEIGGQSDAREDALGQIASSSAAIVLWQIPCQHAMEDFSIVDQFRSRCDRPLILIAGPSDFFTSGSLETIDSISHLVRPCDDWSLRATIRLVLSQHQSKPPHIRAAEQVHDAPRKVLQGGETAQQPPALEKRSRSDIERALRATEERLHLSLMASNQGLWEWHLNTGEVHLCPRFLEFSGFSAPTVPFKYPIQYPFTNDRIHPDDLPEVQQTTEKHLRGETDVSIVECRIRRSDGQFHWIRAVGKVVDRDRNGSPIRMIGSISNINERKRTELSLRQHRKAIESANYGIILIDAKSPEQPITFVNPAFTSMTGYSAKEAIGRSFHFLSRAGHDETEPNELRNAIREGRACQAEIRNYRKDGSLLWNDVNIAPIIGHSGEITQFFGLFHDVTNRKIAEDRVQQDIVIRKQAEEILRRSNDELEKRVNDRTAKLRESEERLRIFVENVPAGAAMFDREMRYLAHSIRWCTDYRIGDQNLIGQSYYAGFPLLPEHHRQIHDNCLSGIAQRCEEEPFQLADGSIEYFRWEIQPWRDADGVVGGLAIFTERITEKKQMESQALQAQKLQAVGQLAGGIAHDFNNFLLLISCHSDQLLAQLPQDDSNRRAVIAMRDAGARAARLTSQLLAFSRKQVLDIVAVDVNELIVRSTPLIRGALRENIILKLDLAPEPATIDANPGQIDQVLLNLILNAQDAMPQGGRLTIATSHDAMTVRRTTSENKPWQPRCVRLTVSDTGTGMTEGVKSRLFEPYFTTKPIGKGTGLGLAVVHGIVSQCRGTIQVESTLGVGTELALFFPASDNQAVPQVIATPQSKVVSGTETILLVEDDANVRQILKSALETEGYKVLDAAHGPAAIATAVRHDRPIDLLLTDVVMPEMSGAEVARSLAETFPKLPTIFMSGFADDDDLLRATSERANSFLQKPFEKNDLLLRVRDVLDSHQEAGH